MTAPEKIYLIKKANRLHYYEWKPDRYGKFDSEYIRADIAQAEIEKHKAAVEKLAKCLDKLHAPEWNKEDYMRTYRFSQEDIEIMEKGAKDNHTSISRWLRICVRLCKDIKLKDVTNMKELGV